MENNDYIVDNKCRKCKKTCCLSIVLGIIGILFAFSLGLVTGATLLAAIIAANLIPFILLTVTLFILLVILFILKLCYCEQD